MKRLIPAGILAVAMVAAGVGSTLSTQAQVPPARFFGQATISGQPAPPGTEVRAYIGEAECGMGTVNEEGRYVVDVKSKAEDAPNCGEEGALVVFVIGGQTAVQTGNFQTGYFIALDLSTDAPAEQPPMPEEQPAMSPAEEPQPEQPQPEQPGEGEGEGGGEMPAE